MPHPLPRPKGTVVPPRRPDIRFRRFDFSVLIVPAGVLFSSTKGAKKVRELLLTECELQAVVAMPSGVFKPYSGVSTAALIFEKRQSPLPLGEGKGEGVWFYDMTADILREVLKLEEGIAAKGKVLLAKVGGGQRGTFYFFRAGGETCQIESGWGCLKGLI